MNHFSKRVSALLLVVLCLTTLFIPDVFAESTGLITVNSHGHCCFNTAQTVEFPPGTSVITYTSGAWINHLPGGAYLGYVRLEIPELGLSVTMGTDEQVGFPTYGEAEFAAMGDFEVVENSTDEPVTAYLFVEDSCNYGGYCHDNSGEVLLTVVDETVENNEVRWGLIKDLFR